MAITKKSTKAAPAKKVAPAKAAAPAKKAAPVKAAPAKVAAPVKKSAPVKAAPAKAVVPAKKVAPVKAAPAKAVVAAPVKAAPAKAVAAAPAKVAPKVTTKVLESQEVLFSVYSPDSKSVDIAGEFNGWDPAKGRMKKAKDGSWSLKTKLAPGSYQYKVVFDSTYWELDQKAPSIQAEHGPNSVINVD